MNHLTTQIFDPLHVELNGVNLIEASAGTGKTFNITVLFLRLLLEEELTVNQILVVTFTEAATAELRDRIRQRLHNALEAFQYGIERAKDDILQQLVATHPQPQQAIDRLIRALRGFDEASIFTIHSFCLQMLRDSAFESGVLFEQTLLQDQSSLLQNVVEDFWRQHFYHENPLFLDYVLKTYRLPEDLLRPLGNGRYVGQPLLKAIPSEVPQINSDDAIQAFNTFFQQVQQAWQQQQGDIEKILIDNSALNGKTYKSDSVRQWLTELALFFSHSASLNLPEKLEKLTPEALVKGTKKNQQTPTHPLFVLFAQLIDQTNILTNQFDAKVTALKIKLFQHARAQLNQLKRQKNLQSFDDLLINLHQALLSENGQRFAKRIYQRYRAALIDEFQDTDPLQYNIFTAIYPPEQGGAQYGLFLIGDPKQAIYSFRGADIFAYLQASHSATRRYSLDKNYRSEARLIHATNQLFLHTTNPFKFDQIHFYPVNAPENCQQPALTINGEVPVPLRFWFIERTAEDKKGQLKPIAKNAAMNDINFAVGYEIRRLLSGEYRIGDNSVMAGDIAILVRSNRQARQMQQTLTQLRIPSVIYSQDSLFDSAEILDIERLLNAITQPQREDWLKAALTTSLLGLNGDELYQLSADAVQWQRRLKQFQYYHDSWQKQGFIQMFRQLLVKEHIAQRLLQKVDGERRLTNILHASEVLQQAVVENKLTMNRLCQWLAQKIRQPRVNDEIYQLRLESDERRIKIYTIHKSKGLEYSIVFCPFVWDGKLYSTQAAELLFHQPEAENQLTLDLGSENQEIHREYAQKEELAENLRLFYVAVTRAKQRCYLVWGGFNDATTAPLAHLLYANVEDLLKLNDTALRAPLQQLASQANIAVEPMPTDKVELNLSPSPNFNLQARQFNRPLEQQWHISSFTSLTRQLHNVEVIEIPDHDETLNDATVASVEEPPSDSIAHFPRGAKAGICIHALFENLDFNRAIPDGYVAKILKQHQFDVEQWEASVTEMFINVLNTPLDPHVPTLQLANVAASACLKELEFTFPLEKINANGLQQIFLTYPEFNPLFAERIKKLQFDEVQGMLKGYIDLIFEFDCCYYVVDYKTNHLGMQDNDYRCHALDKIMAQEAYFLQYLIYSVALHRYLQLRLPNYCYKKHFGGVLYLFVRGMRPDLGSDFGVYRDCPPESLITALSNYFHSATLTT